MQISYEQVIEAASHLSAEEIHRLGEWVRERETRQNLERNGNESKVKEKIRKFNLTTKWIAENRDKYLGQWVCLDGDVLISAGEDSLKVFQEAISKGIESPFMEYIKAEESHYLGGWEKCR